jgi:Baseplate J-like protein
MPIQLPNLDDRTYDDLVAEGLHLIPTYAPEWTNYNPADPGITLIELFAYLTELLIYRLDRVTDENKAMFLKLINGPDWKRKQSLDLDEEIRATIQQLRKTDRAVTCADFERLALDAHPQIARAHCIPRINLLSDNKAERQGYISIVILPKKEAQLSTEQLIAVTNKYLDERRLIATRISISEPIYLQIRVKVNLFLKPDASDRVKEKAIEKLQQFFDPLTGGQTGTGWEFGRSIYISEIYELLDELPEVDYAEEVTILKQLDGNPLWVNIPTALMEIALKPNQLIQLQIVENDITLIKPDRQTLGGL